MKLSGITRGAVAATTALGMIALAGCSGASDGGSSLPSATGSGDPTATITFMEAMSSGAQQEALHKLTDDFEKAHPSIKVNLEEQPDYGTLRTKISAQTSAGQPPTIAQVYESWASEYADSEVIVPLDDYAKTSSNFGDFYAGVQKDLKLPDGKTWMWPFNKSVVVVYRNPDLVSDPSETWDDFAAAATKASSGKVVALSIDPGSSSGPAGGTAFFEILAEAYGDPVFADDGTPQFDKAGSVKAMQYLVDLKKAGALALGTNYPGQTALGAQTGAFDVSSVASYPFNKEAVGSKFDLAVDQVPAGPAGQKNQLAGTNIAMFSAASDDEKRAAWTYMEYLAAPAQQAYWAEQTGYLPVNKKALDEEGFQAYAKSTPFVTEATQQLDTASALPGVATVQQASGLLAVAIQDCVNKGADPTATLAKAQQQAEALQSNG